MALLIQISLKIWLIEWHKGKKEQKSGCAVHKNGVRQLAWRAKTAARTRRGSRGKQETRGKCMQHYSESHSDPSALVM